MFQEPGGPRMCCVPAIMRGGRPCQSAKDVACALKVPPTSPSTATGTSTVEGACLPPAALIGMTRLLGSADAESGDRWCYQGGRSANGAACEASPMRTGSPRPLSD